MRPQPSSDPEHPALPRVHRRIAAAAAAVVVVHGWPASGSRQLCDGLARVLVARDVVAADLASVAGSGWSRLIGTPDDEIWRQVTAWQPADQGGKLLVHSESTSGSTLANVAVLAPSEVLLDADEILAWLASRGHRSVALAVLDWLLGWSGGWLGALRRLHLPAAQDQQLTTSLLELAAGSAARPIADLVALAHRWMLGTIMAAGALPLADWRAASEFPPVSTANISASKAEFDAVVDRWFPTLTPADTLVLPPALHLALRSVMWTDEETASRRRWLYALGQVAGRRGDLAASIRLARLAGVTPEPMHSLAATDQVGLQRQKPVIDLRLFGHGRVETFDQTGRRREVSWRLRRAFHVIAYLALAPERRASRAELVEALWADADPDTIRKNFHPVLSDARRTLRQALSEWGIEVRGIIHSQGIYRLDPGIEWRCDVEVFERDSVTSTESAPAEGILLDRWLRAWTNYRGPLLDGRDEAWVMAPRERLARRYLELLRHIGAACAVAGRLILALDAYRSALLEDPYDEPVHRAVMELYAAQGRRDLVLVQFLRLQDHLKELNVEPRAETQRCYDRLMRPATVADHDEPAS